MKNMKLDTKMTLGFGGLIFIACMVAILTIWIMKDVIIQTLRLGEEYIPQVSAAYQTERASVAASDAMRLYTVSREERHLNVVKTNLAQIKNSLAAAEQLAQKFPDLATLKNAVTKIKVMLGEYENLNHEIIGKTAAFGDNQRTVDKLSVTLMNQCMEFMDIQTEAMKKQMASEFISATESEQLQERFKKITFIQDVIKKGNIIYVGYSEFQADRKSEPLENALKNFDSVIQSVDNIKKITHKDENVKKIEEMTDITFKYRDALTDLLKNWKILQELGNTAEKIGNDFLKETAALADTGMKETLDISYSTGKSLSTASKIIVIGLVFGLISSIIFAVLMIRSITKPVKQMIADISKASVEVRSASDQISRVSQTFAEGLSEQAAALQQSSSSLEELESFTRQNADNASGVNHLMQETDQIIEKANASMNELISSMDNITKSGQDTFKIVKLIEGISFQTNILALNAAIEASRAGDSGSGFAVVAEEVRNLSKQISSAIQEVSQLTERIIAEIREGSESVSRNNKAFSNVAENVAGVSRLIRKISEDSEEQSRRIGHITKAVAEIDKVVQNNAAGSEETASSAEELRAQAAQLVGFVDNMEIMIKGKSV